MTSKELAMAMYYYAEGCLSYDGTDANTLQSIQEIILKSNHKNSRKSYNDDGWVYPINNNRSWSEYIFFASDLKDIEYIIEILRRISVLKDKDDDFAIEGHFHISHEDSAQEILIFIKNGKLIEREVDFFDDAYPNETGFISARPDPSRKLGTLLD